MQRLTQEFAFSQRHACELVEIPRSTHRYRSRKDDSALRERLLALAHEQPRYGYRRLCVLLNDDGAVVNHKRVQRVYRAAGLQVKRIRRRRLSRSAAHPRFGCDRRLHARMFGAGDRHELSQPQID